MKVQNIPFKALQDNVVNTKICAKSVVISLSVLLGACASTGDKPDEVPAANPAKVEKTVQEVDKTPAPSAAELMKTLKAPLVEPPSVEVKATQAKPASTPVKEVVKKDVAKKAVAETSKKVEVVKVEAAKVVEPPVVETVKSAPEPKKVAQVVSVGVTEATPFNVSAKKLPFTYDIWTIREGDTPLTKGLVIATPTWEMGKEGYMSQIWLTMMEDEIHVNSSSDIETASKGLGIRIDGGDLIPFTSFSDNNVGIISGKWLNSFAAANKIDVYLGFFPGKKPMSETFVSDLSLKNFARMVATYRTLNR